MVVRQFAPSLLVLAGAALGFVFAGQSTAQTKAKTTTYPFNSVWAATRYAKESGHGFDLGSKLKLVDKGVTSDQPFFFSVDLPEGNYDVTVSLGNPDGKTVNTVRAE